MSGDVCKGQDGGGGRRQREGAVGVVRWTEVGAGLGNGSGRGDGVRGGVRGDQRRYTRLAVPENNAVFSVALAPAARRLKAFHSTA